MRPQRLAKEGATKEAKTIMKARHASRLQQTRDLPSLCRTERATVFRQRTGHNRLNHALFVNVRMVSQCTSCPIMCDPYCIQNVLACVTHTKYKISFLARSVMNTRCPIMCDPYCIKLSIMCDPYCIKLSYHV